MTAVAPMVLMEAGLDAAWSAFQRQISALEADKAEWRERSRRMSVQLAQQQQELMRLRGQRAADGEQQMLMARKLRKYKAECQELRAVRRDRHPPSLCAPLRPLRFWQGTQSRVLCVCVCVCVCVCTGFLAVQREHHGVSR
jgi:hypothetical protein